MVVVRSGVVCGVVCDVLRGFALCGVWCAVVCGVVFYGVVLWCAVVWCGAWRAVWVAVGRWGDPQNCRAHRVAATRAGTPAP